MSRIEKALEKAARLNEGKKSGGREDVVSPVSSRKVATGINGFSPYVVTLKEPDSAISEEYRKLKSMVVKMTKRGGFKNTVLVTSSLVGEGKSITALNLALTLSQEYDHTVLLVDADLRNPSINAYLNLEAEAGLADCLEDGLDIGAVMLNIDVGNLTLLPAGRKVKNPAELLSSRRMQEFLDDMKHRYSDRYIIIDTPPVLPFAETFSLSTMVDSVLFVVREGTSSSKNIGDALEVLGKENLLGIVYNDASDEGSFGHYQYYYNYRKYVTAREK